VTFESCETRNKVLSHTQGINKYAWSQKKANPNITLFEHHPIVTRAPSPSDIIWENYSFPKRAQSLNRIKILVLISVLYSTIFYGMVRLYTVQDKYDELFNRLLDCTTVSDIYESYNQLSVDD
jgi:hypothetical protein